VTLAGVAAPCLPGAPGSASSVSPTGFSTSLGRIFPAALLTRVLPRLPQFRRHGLHRAQRRLPAAPAARIPALAPDRGAPRDLQAGLRRPLRPALRILARLNRTHPARQGLRGRSPALSPWRHDAHRRRDPPAPRDPQDPRPPRTARTPSPRAAQRRLTPTGQASATGGRPGPGIQPAAQHRDRVVPRGEAAQAEIAGRGFEAVDGIPYPSKATDTHHEVFRRLNYNMGCFSFLNRARRTVRTGPVS